MSNELATLRAKEEIKKEANEAKEALKAFKKSHKEALSDANKATLKTLTEDYNLKRDRAISYGVSFRQDLVDSKTILSVEHLKMFFTYGGDYKTKAVHDISFQIKEGECFGLVGESGCGKTTTGRCIMHLYNITSGSIYYKGYRISGGTRWNEKEIKWSKIHTAEKIKAIKEKEARQLSSLPKDTDLRKEIEAAKKSKDHEIKELGMMSDDEKEEAISEISSRYDPTIKELETLLKNASLSESEQAAAIKKLYSEEIKSLEENEKKHVYEQKELIKKIKYDNRHLNRHLMNEIQMIFQDPVDSLDPRMTVEDIIQEGLHIQHEYNKAENHQKCVDMLEKVGLIPEYASRYPHEFSGGQRQRIGIARALVMNPKMLICDEPISALDVSIRAQILNLLNDVKEEMGLTIMFIAHDLSVVKYFCDKIAVMYFGNLVELASSDELFKHPLHPYTKALLSAIPKPDPRSEKHRVRKIYNPAKDHDYSVEKPTFQEIVPGHFVLCNSVEFSKYKEEISILDQSRGEKK